MARSFKRLTGLPMVGNILKEFLEGMFHKITGHNHDGTEGEGPKLPLTSIDAHVVVGVAGGYKVARGVTAVTGTGAITTGLATVVAVSAVLAADADLTGTLVTTTIPTQTGGDAGKFTAKVWKPTAANDCTPIAADAEKSVSWIAVGT